MSELFDSYKLTHIDTQGVSLESDGKVCKVVQRKKNSNIATKKSIRVFVVKVGNETGKILRRINLTEYLDSISVKFDSNERILYSQQACIFENAMNKDIKFNIRLINPNTTTLVIVSTSHGTCYKIVSGKDTNVFFNQNGDVHK